MLSQDSIEYNEQLYVSYEQVLLSVEAGGVTTFRNNTDGALVPLQRVPAMAQDRKDADIVTLALLTLPAGEKLSLTPVSDLEAMTTQINVTSMGKLLEIRNGLRAVRIPSEGLVEQPFPGPICGMQLANSDWFGESLLVDTAHRGYVRTVIESLGPCCVQWQTTYHWGNDHKFSFRARWATGSDTIEVVEEIALNSDAAVEWYPFDKRPAYSLANGGGERQLPMTTLQYAHTAAATCGKGRRRLNSISHISYFNQWNLAWVGFTRPEDSRFVGLFSGWGSLWNHRGAVRPDIYEDDERGHFMRFPMKAGRRLYGIVIANWPEADGVQNQQRCLLNRRKAAHSDLALNKVMQWVLNSPLEEQRTHLIKQHDLETFRQRIASDPSLAQALNDGIAQGDCNSVAVPIALWTEDDRYLTSAIADLRQFILQSRSIGEGGYERLIIFDGRNAKCLAFSVDALWALGKLSIEDYQAVQCIFTAFAYMFADPDYTVYADFWAVADPESEMLDALKDDIGDCPVPPNFASEFFTTTGQIAELFPSHPQSSVWRQWAIEQTKKFLDHYFTPDGAYLESINYHVHMFAEMVSYIYPLALNGGYDFFADPRVKGSFKHLLRLQTPPLATNILPFTSPVLRDTWNRWISLSADWRNSRRSMLPANGNSGGEGFEQEHGTELSMGAAIYRDRDPQLAGELMTAWRRAGRPMIDHVHPLLTLVTLDPAISACELPDTSVWLPSLGVVSRAQQSDDSPVYALFRAGKCTHHMCYDQGNLQLIYGDTVLLGDHGYHDHDQHGNAIPCAATWVHNTVVYADNKHLSSGYTGMERAPEPVLVHTGEAFDWCVHRIVNTNFRNLDCFEYRVMLPDPVTVHIRHYLFVKPDYFLIWDIFEAAHQPSLFFLQPRSQMQQFGEAAFRAGETGSPQLVVHFLQPEAPVVVVNEQLGPYYSFAISNDTAQPYLALIAPEMTDRHLKAVLADDGRTINITGIALDDIIRLPEPASSTELPIIERRII